MKFFFLFLFKWYAFQNYDLKSVLYYIKFDDSTLQIMHNNMREFYLKHARENLNIEFKRFASKKYKEIFNVNTEEKPYEEIVNLFYRIFDNEISHCPKTT